MHRNVLPCISYAFTGETIPCPVCGSNESSVVARIDRRLKPLTTVMCDDCGLFYSNPMPTKSELKVYYQSEYRKDYQFALLRPSRKHVQKKRREAGVRYGIGRSEWGDGAMNVLDFGCGSGELVREFAVHGHEAHGFEPGTDYSGFAAREHGLALEIQNASYETAVYPPRGFDVITMLHVLEHIPDPIEALVRAREWLKDDGILYIEVPNMQAYELKGFEHFHFAHVLGFSRDNLILALRRAGFRVRRELAGTSLIAEKDDTLPCDAAIDLAGTSERNRRDYGRPITPLAYVRYHIVRGFRRAAKRLGDRRGAASAPTLPGSASAKIEAGAQVD